MHLPVTTIARSHRPAKTARHASRLITKAYPYTSSDSPEVTVQRKPTCACGGGCPKCQAENTTEKTPVIQPKLRIGKPNGKYEQEADRVAEQVMRMSDPLLQRQIAEEEEEETLPKSKAPVHVTPVLQRQPIEEEEEILLPKSKAPVPVTPVLLRQPIEEEEEELLPKSKAPVPVTPVLQRQPIEEEEEEFQAKRRERRPAAASPPGFESRVQQVRAGGEPLSDSLRSFFEPRFGYDFGGVRIHDGSQAAAAADQVNARAFTVGQDVVFGVGQCSPDTRAGRSLLAHELTHVLQQTRGTGAEPRIQRVVEVRPPGRGEASAFDRHQELVDRLNAISTGMEYSLDGRRLQGEVVDEAALSNFDRQMQEFMSPDTQVVPMRLITRSGYVGGQPLLVDEFNRAYVDLDDLMASDDVSFQSMLVHFLAERFSVRDYARRIGTNLDPLFDRAHRIGREAEADLLRDILGDPSIQYVYEERRPNGTLVVGFRSRDERYRVFIIIRGAGREVRGGIVRVLTRDRRRISLNDFLRERAAAAAPAPG